MIVVKVVEHDVLNKVDTQYIREQFSDFENIGIIYVCTTEGGEDDDWVDEKGLRHIIISLPYEEVRKMDDVRPLMLSKAKERLGLVA